MSDSKQSKNEREELLLLPQMSGREILLTLFFAGVFLSLTVAIVGLWSSLLDSFLGSNSWIPEWLMGFGRRIVAAVGGAILQFPGTLLATVVYRFWSARERAKKQGIQSTLTYAEAWQQCVRASFRRSGSPRNSLEQLLASCAMLVLSPLPGCLPAVLLAFVLAVAAWCFSLATPGDTHYWVIGGMMAGGIVHFGLFLKRLTDAGYAGP